MDAQTNDMTLHSTHSTLRERIVEHLFVGQILRVLWRRRIVDVEVLHSEFDAYGYDLVMSHRDIVRHIQLKTSVEDGRADETKASLSLLEKPSGCIIWIIVTPDLKLRSYLWFGGSPGEPMPDIRENKVAKHSKGDAHGTKSERANYRVIRRTRFKNLGTLDDVLFQLFGSFT
jgi:hypothetical protein